MSRGRVRIITHRKLNLTEQEFNTYKDLLNRHGESINYYLNTCVEFDSDGYIVEFGIADQMPMELLYYLMVVSVNQRLRKVDDMAETFNKKMATLDSLIEKKS